VQLSITSVGSTRRTSQKRPAMALKRIQKVNFVFAVCFQHMDFFNFVRGMPCVIGMIHHHLFAGTARSRP
jgi:hypothetical protein